MKKLLLIVAATLVCVSAFAQGKVSFAADSAHLVYFTTDVDSLRPTDGSLAGAGVYAGTIPAGVSLVADLWAGPTAGALSKVTSVATWSASAPGRWTTTSVVLPTTMAGNVLGYFQVDIHDATAASAEEAWGQLNKYGGQSTVFTMVPGISTYVAIANTGAGQSTWAAGTQPIGTSGFGAIKLYATVPEPGTFALAGLGLATLLIFRRRK